ncbi:3'-5' exonuclease [Pontibacter akesuensis]|uniref:DNA polymerase-3 subunit epsilon n=1 Tax=Pontibacter akesuensis TaxID=388950 RepID=A0A1I7J8M0_9BACT|nr:3'-5' exonuclease [Pontibacter akesuensis]GHA71759.1 DNA polymerase III subunit epsilon [Pontibacter akesuensis]SFU81518.1 DNA polymerase-3 subunit epsilon [Pontibacter akesuensis]
MRRWWKELLRGKPQAAPGDPDFWQAYIRAVNSQFSAANPLATAEFVVFDTETTGLDPKQDKALSIGAVKVLAGQVLVQESFECVVRQQIAHGNKSAEVHGLLRQEVEQGVSEPEALRQLLDFAGGAVLVGHHVAFDMEVVNGMIKGSGISGKLHNKTLDTAQLAKRLERRHHSPDSFSRSDYTLDSLIHKYNLSNESRHTAAGDAFITAILLLKLLAQAKKRGINMVGELVR